MRKITYKITASFLALLVLLSTFSWTVEKHLCFGRVVDVAFFSSAESCCELTQSVCSEKGKPSCCDNEAFTIQGQDKLAKIDFQVEFEPLCSSILQKEIIYKGVVFEVDVLYSNKWYPPPILIQDRTILYEVFLI